MKISICIPSLNEADIIQETTNVVDRGLSRFFKQHRCYIVNADNNSKDDTKNAFLSTKTKTEKVYISSKPGEKGKGYNLRNFWQFCKEKGIDLAANIDADISTIEDNWPHKLILPLINERIDYITPLYTRSRFEGSTTNHFAFPLIYTVFGKVIRQPIGGEFAYNRSVYEYFLNQKFNNNSLGYGIDIFMSIHAIGGGFRVKEQFLGRKLHKPSFSKILPMYKQVFISAFSSVNDYQISVQKSKLTSDTKGCGIDSKKTFAHKENANKLFDKCLNKIREDQREYDMLFGVEKIGSIIRNSKIGEELWSDIYKNFFYLARSEWSDKIEELAEYVLNLFIIRTVTYWIEVEKLTPIEAEKKIIKQAELIKSKIINLK